MHFSVISNAALVRSSSASSGSVLRRRRSSSTCSGERRGLGFGARPWRLAPAGVADLAPLGDVRGVQASLRSSAPVSGEPAESASYSARICALYSAVEGAPPWPGDTGRAGPSRHDGRARAMMQSSWSLV